MNESKIRINKESLNPGQRTNWFYIKGGTSIYRILPPKPESNGYPFKKWIVNWGLVDPQRGSIKPYVSGLMNNNYCPLDDYYKKLKLKIEDMSNETKSLKEDDPKKIDLLNRIKKLNKYLFSMKLRFSYVYNAIDQSGKVGLLVLPFTAHRKLQKTMLEYINTYGQDPTSLYDLPNDSGVWMKFTRTGEGFDTEYDVSKNQITVKDESGGIMYKDDRSPLPKEIQDKYFIEMCKDLETIYTTSTNEELLNVLMINLQNRSIENPDILIPGYDNFSKIKPIEEKKTINTKTEEAKTEPTKPFQEPVVNFSPKISVKIQDVPEGATEEDDLSKMAEAILGE